MMNTNVLAAPVSPGKSPDLHIASLVIFAQPDCRDDIIDFLSNIPACTLYAEESRAALVIVIEVDHERSINLLMDELNARKGILSVNLVYHHVDSEQSLNQELDS